MGSPWFGEERRRTVRISTSVKVKYKISEIPEVERIALSKDISGGGIGLLLDEELKDGTALKLEIDLSSEAGPVSAVGEVVWSKRIYEKERSKFATGIKFTRLEPSEEGKLLKHLYGRQ